MSTVTIFKHDIFPDLKVTYTQDENTNTYEMSYNDDLVPLFIYDTNSPRYIKTFPILYKFDPKRPGQYKQYVQELLKYYEKLPKKINGELRPKLNKKILICNPNELDTGFASYRTLYYNDRIAKSNRKLYTSEEYDKVYPKEIRDHKRSVDYHYTLYKDKGHIFVTTSYELTPKKLSSKSADTVIRILDVDIGRLHYEQMNKRYLLVSIDISGLPIFKNIKNIEKPDEDEHTMNQREIDAYNEKTIINDNIDINDII